MNISQFIKKYGTRTTSLMLARYADTLAGAPALREMAKDLQAALEDYAAENIEPPTVDGRVI